MRKEAKKMREILFRGKTYDGKWEQGDLRHGGYVHNDSETYIMRSDYALHNIPVDTKTVGEYTGMTDDTKWEQLSKEEQSDWLKTHTANKWNGKKIFEGDIISFTRYNALGYITSRIGKVCYGEDCPSFHIEATTGDTWCFSGIEDIKVIGNIHDNPELVKGE